MPFNCTGILWSLQVLWIPDLAPVYQLTICPESKTFILMQKYLAYPCLTSLLICGFIFI